MTGQRAKRDKFGPFEGVFLGEAVQRRLAERLGDEHCWSTSRLEDYAYCPFKFFAKHVLGLAEPEDLVLEIDHLRRGRRVHQLMAAVHRQINSEAGPCSPAQQDEESFKRLVAEKLAGVMESSAADGPLAAAFDDFDARMITAWLDQYLEQHRKYDGGFTDCDGPLLPKHFEVSFGPVAAESDRDTDPLSTASAYELRCGDVVVRLSGRIDRLDVGLVGGKVVFNVLDYKIGTANQYQLKDIESSAILQLPLYAMAVEDLLLAGEKAVPWAGGYWHVKDGGYREKHSLKFHEQSGGTLRPTATWQQLKAELIDRVARIVTAVRSAQFPVHCDDEDCTGRCEFKTVCRVGAVRALEKSWMLPVLSERDK